MLARQCATCLLAKSARRAPCARLVVAAKALTALRSVTDPAMSPQTRRAAIVWFRRDLRLADNEALYTACRPEGSSDCVKLAGHEIFTGGNSDGSRQNSMAMDYVVPLYCLDPREFQPRRPEEHTNSLGLPRLGPHRLRFLLEALESLRQDLRTQHGSDLVVRQLAPEVAIPALLADMAASTELASVELHHSMDVLPESAELEDCVAEAFQQAAHTLGLASSVHRYWGLTLYHPDDLPFKTPGKRTEKSTKGDATPPCRINNDRERYAALPNVMTTFRKALQLQSTIRTALPPPARLPPLPPCFAARSTSSTNINDGTAAGAAGLPPGRGPNPSGPPPASERHQLRARPAAAPAGHVAQQPSAAAGEAPLAAGAGAGAATSSATGAAAGVEAIPASARGVYATSGSLPALQRLQQLAGCAFTDLNAPVHAVERLPHTAVPFVGGEGAALARLRSYLWSDEQGAQGRLAHPPAAIGYFKNSRSQAFGVDNSTKLSAFMAAGCLSPRTIAEEVQRLEQGVAGTEPAKHNTAELAAEQQAEWLIMHLCIRDFFLFTALKEGASMLTEEGIKGQPVQWQFDQQTFARWACGMTGFPFIDACMRELAATGYMSNRGRQNVASFLAKTLHQDWRAGAELFESLLIDHDPGVNTCNWNYFAGIGNDPRNRTFKTVTQGMQYDADGALIAAWVPELSHLPPPLRHQPWLLEGEGARALHAAGYPQPLVEVGSQIGILRPEKGANAKGASGVGSGDSRAKA